MQNHLSGPQVQTRKLYFSHTEVLMWSLKPQEQVLLFCKKKELKLQSSNQWLFWHSVNAFDWQKHTEALQRSVSPTETPGVTAQQLSEGL